MSRILRKRRNNLKWLYPFSGNECQSRKWRAVKPRHLRWKRSKGRKFEKEWWWSHQNWVQWHRGSFRLTSWCFTIRQQLLPDIKLWSIADQSGKLHQSSVWMPSACEQATRPMWILSKSSKSVTKQLWWFFFIGSWSIQSFWRWAKGWSLGKAEPKLWEMWRKSCHTYLWPRRQEARDLVWIKRKKWLDVAVKGANNNSSNEKKRMKS